MASVVVDVDGAPAVAMTRPQALTTRFLDFWLLGGASLLVWLVMISVQGFRSSWAIDQHFRNLAVTTASLSLIVNYPHFLISYKLAYGRGRAFVRQHPWQLVIVPVLLVILFTLAFFLYDVPAARIPGIPWLLALLAPLGSNALVVSGPRTGDVLFTVAFNVMVFTVGWHYTKQVFGCMMVYAYFDHYPLTPAQRTTIKYALLTIWWLTFAYSNVAGAQNSFSQFTYYSLDLPDAILPLAYLLVAGGFVMVVGAVFHANYRSAGRLPSLNMVVPFIALYIWWLPPTRQYEFYLLLTPLFHSIQYLTFVYKMEHTRLTKGTYPEIWGTVMLAGVVLAGWLAFEFLPNTIDTALGTFAAWKIFFFFTAAMLFINVHHYFIDNVLWRFRDREVQDYLLATARQ